jgi:predicted regulator of Ras-like GTPase activity (Roadblock/LC7/MglB family)
MPAFVEMLMLKKILREFLSIDGVIAAALIGRDGFVIESVQKHRKSDTDALGALCSGSIRFFERSGVIMKMGSPRQIMLEYKEGVLILTPVTAKNSLRLLLIQRRDWAT